MLFHATWEFADTSEDGLRRRSAMLKQWKFPEGAEIRGFYRSVDGLRGVALIEADTAQALARTTAPWVPLLHFTVTPILPIEAAAAIDVEGIAFRDSVK